MRDRLEVRLGEDNGMDARGEAGCRFVLNGAIKGSAILNFCDAPRHPGSSYCPRHDALCRLPNGSAAEARKLREIEALATAAGGRQPRAARLPAEAQLRRLDRRARALSRPNCSGIVPKMETGMTQRDKARTVRDLGLGPTPERLRHGPVERIERPIGDAAGRPARPYRAVDTLASMERRGSITAAMRQAGEDFRARFARAHLDPLRALDLSTMRLGERGARPEQEGPGQQIEAARRSVWRAIQAVGGVASPGGSCLWHVVGWECSIKQWALEQGWSGRRVSQEAASGILVAALGALNAHFGGL